MNNNTKKLAQLEDALTTLKSRFHTEGNFSESTLKQLLKSARETHSKTDRFNCFGVRAFACLMQDKIKHGWSYVDHQASALSSPTGSVIIELVKPASTLRLEYEALERKVRTDYQSKIDSIRPALIAEIATTQLQIKVLKEQIEIEEKQAGEYQKMLESVQRELGAAPTSPTTSTKASPEQSQPSHNTSLKQAVVDAKEASATNTEVAE